MRENISVSPISSIKENTRTKMYNSSSVMGLDPGAENKITSTGSEKVQYYIDYNRSDFGQFFMKCCNCLLPVAVAYELFWFPTASECPV